MRKYKYINLFLRVYSINSTFHDTAMCVGQLYNGTMENRFAKKMVQVADWLTHYLTQFNGERPDMVSVFWDDTITVFCLLYIWKTLVFSGELLWWQQCSCLQNTLKDLRAEVQRFSKVNHLVWSTWSVIQVNDSHSILQNIKHEVRILLILQAVSSSIDYDYFEYARIRLGEYLKLKTEQ